METYFYVTLTVYQ